jgi:hypothetical protein
MKKEAKERIRATERRVGTGMKERNGMLNEGRKEEI